MRLLPVNHATARVIMSGMEHGKLVVVRKYGNRPEADLAKSVLDASGIQSIVQADTAGGMREHLAWSGAGFKILVREVDATAARDVLTPPAGPAPMNKADEGPASDSQTDDDAPPTVA